jgi:hypothetical protein
VPRDKYEIDCDLSIVNHTSCSVETGLNARYLVITRETDRKSRIVIGPEQAAMKNVKQTRQVYKCSVAN